MVRVVHDWDFPLHKRSSCFNKALWLLGYAFFGQWRWFRRRMPIIYLWEKYSCLMALIALDRLFDIEPLVGITEQVLEAFPNLPNELSEKKVDVCYHYHVKKIGLGKGAWVPRLDVKPENMIYDRRYTMYGQKALPMKDDIVVWHVDHPYNLSYYIEFLNRCKEAGILDNKHG